MDIAPHPWDTYCLFAVAAGWKMQAIHDIESDSLDIVQDNFDPVPLGGSLVHRHNLLVLDESETLMQLLLRWTQMLFDELLVQLEIFIRTFRLLGLIATPRLLCYALMLRGGERNFDPILRAARFATRPAPVALIFLTFIFKAHAMDAAAWNRVEIADRNLQMAIFQQNVIPNYEFVGDPLDPPDYHRLRDDIMAEMHFAQEPDPGPAPAVRPIQHPSIGKQ